jgi:hypothetical protein
MTGMENGLDDPARVVGASAFGRPSH